MKNLAFVILILMPFQLFAQNLECTSKSGTYLILEEVKKGTHANQLGVQYFAQSDRFYGAECTEDFSPISDNDSVKLVCQIEPEWTYYETVAKVELAQDKKSVKYYEAKIDGRFRDGYRYKDAQNLKCEPTTKTAGR